MRIERKHSAPDPAYWDNTPYPDIVKRIYVNRNIATPADIDKSLGGLLSPMLLGGIDKAVAILADAIVTGKNITISGDYDCDGATGTSVGFMGLKLLGARDDTIRFIIPNREVHGYGLSVGLVDAMPPQTEIILTVDSGVASVEGVAHAKQKGYTVVITDHHLPGDVLPDADAMVNPNLKDDPFPSKMLAGVGVMFYVLLAVKMRLRELGHDGGKANLARLLDLVAIGTVADLVPLDQNNRRLVTAGLDQIRHGAANIGVDVLMSGADKDPSTITSTDISFMIAPRLNSAGRLSDMTLGVKLLTSTDRNEAVKLAAILEDINNERKEVQADMVLVAETIVALTPSNDDIGVVVYDESWHHGVVGLVASKLKEALHRPTIALAPAGEGSDEARGSARSIPGLHLRDILALVEAQNPGLLPKFGGHAMAAGLSIKIADIPKFTKAFNEILKERVTPAMLESIIVTDGELTPDQISLDFANYIERCGPWGQGFTKPIFDGVFEVKSHRILKQKHIKFDLYDVRNGDVHEAIWFFGYKGQEIPQRFLAAYELSTKRYMGRDSYQLLIRQIEPR